MRPRRAHQPQGGDTTATPPVTAHRHTGPAHAPSLAELRAHLRSNGHQLYIGRGTGSSVWAGPEQAVLVLGPPRSGKTSSLVVPNVLAAPGAVVSTSTKLDVLATTAASRARAGACWLFDPTGTTPVPDGVQALRWSPVEACASWEEALVTARVMTQAARPDGHLGESGHWTERAQALLAPLFHAGALSGGGARQVLAWVLRQDLQTPMALLGARSPQGALAMEVLGGILSTEERERSGIFSTAAGVLAPYRSAGALETAREHNFDPSAFVRSAGTVYICSPGRYQAVVAPVVVAFLEQVRAAVYALGAPGPGLPVTLALDELANIAPLPDLPSMVSEGGGQGLLTLACLQDLSQARVRWGRAADGFFSLFGAKVLLPGTGDLATLETVSRLGGQVDVPVRSLTSTPWWTGRPHLSVTRSWRRQPRLPVDAVHSLPRGTALVVLSGRPPALAELTPWWSHPVFSQAAQPQGPPLPPPQPGTGERGPGATARYRGAPLAGLAGTPAPPSPPGGRPGPPDVALTWQRVPGQRRLQPPPPQA